MFGKMRIDPLLEVGPKTDVTIAVGALLALTENTKISRWIQFPAAVFLFLTVEGDPNSGAFYLLDRKSATWYSIDFEDEQFGGYSVQHCDELVRDCEFLALVERPGLLRSGLNWVLAPGEVPVAIA
jgi:hypothetical protein